MHAASKWEKCIYWFCQLYSFVMDERHVLRTFVLSSSRMYSKITVLLVHVTFTMLIIFLVLRPWAMEKKKEKLRKKETRAVLRKTDLPRRVGRWDILFLFLNIFFFLVAKLTRLKNTKSPKNLMYFDEKLWKNYSQLFSKIFLDFGQKRSI